METTKREVMPFQFSNSSQAANSGHEVRAIVDEHGEPWFVANEVCSILGFTRGRDALRMVDDDDKALISFKSALQAALNVPPRGLLIVNEAGLYTMIFQSNKPEARAFKRWVTHEVLPTVRQTGAYVHSDNISLDQMKALNEALRCQLATAVSPKKEEEKYVIV